MSTITSLQSDDTGAESLTILNTNISNLNSDKLEASDITGKQDKPSEGAFANGDKTKLDAVESGADVTNATNVRAAGAPIISSGAGAPSSTPTAVGDIYIDTTGDDAYVAVGTASSADWEKSNGGAGGDAWGDAVDANILPDTTNTRKIGATGNVFDEIHATDIVSSRWAGVDAQIGVYDESGNVVAYFYGNDAVSPVNYLQLENSDTTDPINIRAIGTDTNIDVDIIPKGTGQLLVNGSPITSGARVIVVAASDATDGAGADYTCDGTADEVQINLALAAVQAAGGKVLLTDGTFNLAAAIEIVGETANNVGNPTVEFAGAGIQSTDIIAGTGLNAIEITDEAIFQISNMKLHISGAGNGIDMVAGTERGTWMSRVSDVMVQGDFSTVTSASWGIRMDSPFRMRFENIEMNGVYNGMWLTSSTESFNPGNLSVDRIFINFWSSATNGIGIKLSTLATTSTGVMNLCHFNRVDIAGNDNVLTGSIGIHLVGGTSDPGASYYGEVRQNVFSSLNIEGVQTGIKLEAAAENSFYDIGYTRINDTGTFFECDDESNSNYFSNAYISVGDNRTATVISDANTDTANPNIFERFTGYNASTVTLNGTVTSATIIRYVNLDNGGPTVDTDLDENVHYLGAHDFTGATVTGISGGGDVVDDTTPQLGGSLDVNGNSIVSVTNGNIALAPNGTGRVDIIGDNNATVLRINATEFNSNDDYTRFEFGDANHYVASHWGLGIRIEDVDGIVLNESGNSIDIRMEGNTDTNLFFLDGSADNVGIGTATPAAKLDVNGTVKTLGYTVATLPTGVTGMRAYVTDATSPTYNGTLTGGGSVTVPVFYNGSAWVSA